MTIEIRSRTADDIPGEARVVVDTWRSTYRGIVPDELLDSLSYADRERAFLRRIEEGGLNIGFVAVDSERGVIGFASGGPERDHIPGYPGELYAIYILAAYQGRGIGRRLVRAVFEQLVLADLSPAIIWTLEQNPACAFYRKLGGVEVGRKFIEIGGKKLLELGFGYSNLTVELSPSETSGPARQLSPGVAHE